MLRDVLNRSLDNLARPGVAVLGRSRSAFQICGCTGLVLAVLLAMTLVTRLDLSPWVMGAVALGAVLAFLGLAMGSKIVAGEERLVYYYHEVATIVVTAVLLRLLRQPILPYLDMTILGVGLFLACGRVGCLMAGCCHGRPHSWGVVYREEHAAAGFTPYYVGVRLFPIQAVESLWVCCVVVAGSVLVWNRYQPGTALAWYVVSYDIGRFCFEFMRGDPERPYLRGFSEAQWISLALMGVVVWAELTGVLPLHAWHVGATAALAVVMSIVAIARRSQGSAYRVLQPCHVREVAAALDLGSLQAVPATAGSAQHVVPAGIRVGCTSLGIRISSGTIQDGVRCIHHYTLSQRQGPLTEETAGTLAGLITQLKHASTSTEIVRGNRGVYHVLVRPAAGSSGITPVPAGELRS